ncbi:MAG: hypothetical protein I8H66_11500 [Sphingobacteriia bacterium]|nr:hypothetical protein [Sphingobacteriia bacterium]
MSGIAILEVPFMIEHIFGTIVHINRYHETRTRTSGGGGKIYTSPWTGKVQGEIKPTETHTYTNVTYEIHYKDSTGKEDYFRLANQNLPFREGQMIEIVHLFNNRGINQMLFLGINNLRKKYKIATNYQFIIDAVYNAKYQRIHSIISVVFGAILSLSSFLRNETITGLFILLVGYLVSKRILSFVQKKVIKKKVIEQIEPIWKDL